MFENAGLTTEFIGSPFTTSNISYTATGLSGLTQYLFVVHATNGVLTSNGCGAVTATTAAIVYTCPIATKTPAATSFSLSWSTVSGAEGYQLIVYNDAAGLNVRQTYTAANNASYLSQTQSGLTASTTYYFRVSAMVGGVAVGSCSIQAITTTA